MVVSWYMSPTRSVSRSLDPITRRSTTPPKTSRVSTSGDDSGWRSGLSPENELFAGMKSPSTVSVLDGERVKSTRVNETMPVVPTAGVPD